MKKLLLFSTFGVLLLGAIFIYACQKEKPTIAAAPATSMVDNVASEDRSGTCSTITVGRGDGLFICGVDSGTTGCTVCGEGHSGQMVVGAANVYNFTGSSVFSLYNTTTHNITVAISFNCVNQAPQWFTITPGSTLSLTTTVVNGCCFAVPCGGGG